MASDAKPVHPEVTWAQRSSTTDPERNHILLTIAVPDVAPEDLKLDLQPTRLSFSGFSSSKKVTYAVDMELFAEIDPKESKTTHTARDIELVLRKAELEQEYWPRLLKGTQKEHYLKTDFNKWVDEDEQDEVSDAEGAGMPGGMPPMGGMGGMPGMEGMGGMGGMGGGGFDMESLMKQMGGAGGAGGMPGMPDMSGMGDDEDDDEEEMPDLEGESADKGKGPATDEPVAAGSSKIEEVE